MINQHPITPPPELVKKWADSRLHNSPQDLWRYIALLAAQWGADQELEACCEWAQGYAECGDSLRIARRPKPPSLAEEALETLKYPKDFWSESEVDTIRRALERLQELEGGK